MLIGIRCQDVAAGLRARVTEHGKRANLPEMVKPKRASDAENLFIRFDKGKGPSLLLYATISET